MSKQEYPKVLYTGVDGRVDAVEVADKAVHDALGPGYFETPGEAEKAAAKVAKKAEK